MRNSKLVITKDKVKRKSFLKNEIKKIILKSVFRNFQINEILRAHALKKLTFLEKKSFISKQNNVCLITGRFGGVFKKYDLSRHSIKKIAKLNFLQNTKIAS
jgi:ribosomal protein S14